MMIFRVRFHYGWFKVTVYNRVLLGRKFYIMETNLPTKVEVILNTACYGGPRNARFYLVLFI